MKSVLKLLSHEKLLTGVALVLILVNSLTTVGSAITLAPLTDQLIRRNLRGVLFWLALTGGIWAVTLFLVYINSVLQAQITRKISNQLRAKIVDGLDTISLPDYQKVNHNEYVSWLTNDVNMINQNGLSIFFGLVGNCATFIFAVGSLFVYHYSLAMLTLTLGALTLAIPHFFSKIMERETHRLSNANSRLLGKIDDMIGGFSVFFSHNIGRQLTQRIVNASDKQGAQKVVYARNVGLVDLLINAVNVTAQMAVLALTCLLAIQGFFTVGVITTSGQLAGTVFSNLGQMIEGVFQMKSVPPLLKKDIKDTEISPATANPSFKHALTIDHLTYSYDHAPLIQNLSYRFEKGGKYALLGKSGVGKSTLIKLLSGRLQGYQGQISIDGCDISKMAATSLNAKIEVVDQKSYIFNETVAENINLGVTHEHSLYQRAIDFLGITSFAPLNTQVREHGNNFSGGQRQKIALARALTFHKPILILDEVTAGIDEANAQKIENTLLAEKGLTVIMITHHLTATTKRHLTGTLTLTPPQVSSATLANPVIA
ncbi:MAG: ABC transporter ATP-binding protein/permease [Schleiferilactobacillus harbinensis]|jgi:ATP-binding cassette subfamily C protein|nr:ABC transporter ATP-binding protein/permease [Schleiferilactobacillus harbinensis]MCI1913436.1 ABC transporter ATP-binding protein/permease [Schleiferilactobacillus harbinensis]